MAFARLTLSDRSLALFPSITVWRPRLAGTCASVTARSEAMHYVYFNTIAHGMRLDAPFSKPFSDMTSPDIAPGGRFEHVLPGGRPPPGAPSPPPAK